MIIVSVDFGDSRTGLAVCDRQEMLASPAGVIFEKRFDPCVEKVAQKAREFQSQLVVVGHPVNMNGTIGPRAEKCQDFAHKLEAQLDVPVVLWDERCTTVTAIGFLNETDTRGKKRKQVIDAVAATIILENYLSYRRNQASRPETEE